MHESYSYSKDAKTVREHTVCHVLFATFYLHFFMQINKDQTGRAADLLQCIYITSH